MELIESKKVNFGMASLNQRKPMFHFYNPWKHQKTKGGIESSTEISGGLEMEYSTKVD